MIWLLWSVSLWSIIIIQIIIVIVSVITPQCQRRLWPVWPGVSGINLPRSPRVWHLMMVRPRRPSTVTGHWACAQPSWSLGEGLQVSSGQILVSGGQFIIITWHNVSLGQKNQVEFAEVEEEQGELSRGGSGHSPWLAQHFGQEVSITAEVILISVIIHIIKVIRKLIIILLSEWLPQGLGGIRGALL